MIATQDTGRRRLTRGERLLAALEELVSDEEFLVSSGDIDSALAVQDRAAPVVAVLCGMAGSPDCAAIAPRVQALIERRARTCDRLSAERRRMAAELRGLSESRARLRRLGPAYGAARSPARFSVAA